MQGLAYCPTGTPTAWTSDGTPWHAAVAADERGLADRLTLHERDARQYVADGDYDLVMCVGSTHLFGGFDATVRLAGQHVNADGILLAGEGFWQVLRRRRRPSWRSTRRRRTSPTSPAWSMWPSRPAGRRCTRTSVTPPSGSYEWSWVGSLTEWALDNPGHPDAAEARPRAPRAPRAPGAPGAVAARVRNVPGFATLVLRRT